MSHPRPRRNTATNIFTRPHPLPPPSRPKKSIEFELAGFYDPKRSVYIDKITGLFKYNFNSPPRTRPRSVSRVGVRPLSGVRYSPYLGYKAREEVERRRRGVVVRQVEMGPREYVELLKERGRVRRVEEVEDVKRAEELCREFGLGMEGEDGGVDVEGDGDVEGEEDIDDTSDFSDSGSGSDGDIDGEYEEGSTKDDMEDGSTEESESLDSNDIWENEANQSYLTRIGSVFR